METQVPKNPLLLLKMVSSLFGVLGMLIAGFWLVQLWDPSALLGSDLVSAHTTLLLFGFEQLLIMLFAFSLTPSSKGRRLMYASLASTALGSLLSPMGALSGSQGILVTATGDGLALLGGALFLVFVITVLGRGSRTSSGQLMVLASSALIVALVYRLLFRTSILEDLPIFLRFSYYQLISLGFTVTFLMGLGLRAIGGQDSPTGSTKKAYFALLLAGILSMIVHLLLQQQWPVGAAALVLYTVGGALYMNDLGIFRRASLVGGIDRPEVGRPEAFSYLLNGLRISSLFFFLGMTFAIALTIGNAYYGIAPPLIFSFFNHSIGVGYVGIMLITICPLFLVHIYKPDSTYRGISSLSVNVVALGLATRMVGNAILQAMGLGTLATGPAALIIIMGMFLYMRMVHTLK